MRVLRIILLTVLLPFLLLSSAYAQNECGGSIAQADLGAEIKELNKVIQKKVIEYRTLEGKLPTLAKGSEEAAAAEKQMANLKGELQYLKKDFQDLNSPHFPTTQFNVYGAACQDRRWVAQAKKYLAKFPEARGKLWHVWLDKESRETVYKKKRPEPGSFAK